MRKASHGRLVLIASLCAFLGFATTAQANNAWGCYHWARSSNPLNLNLGDNVSSAWDSYLATASSDWSASTVLDTAVVPGGTTANTKKCNATTGRVEVCNNNYGGSYLGVAQIWVSGCHITKATAKMNDFFFKPGSSYNTPAWRRLVMCQEVGHTFGLDHQDTNFNNANLGSCMDYTSDPDGPPSNEHPNLHDYDQLVSIYSHLDSPQAAPQTAPPPAMTDLDLEGPGQWGRLIRSTNGGRTELYELDFGGGNKIVTFVIWADGADRGRGRGQGQ